MKSKCILNPKSALAALKPIKGIINTSSVLSILECVVIKVNEGKMNFLVTDLETVAHKSIDIEQKPGESWMFCVDFALFYKFCLNSENAPATLEYNSEKNNLCIVQEGLVLNLPTEDANNFPKSPDVEGKWTMGINAKEYFSVIKNALLFVSSDDLRPAMTGVYMHDAGNKGLMVVSTDAHRMFYHPASSKTPDTMKDSKAIIPAKSLRVALECMNKDVDLKYIASDNHMLIEANGYSICARLIDARYPDYAVVMVAPETHFYLKRKQMSSFLKLAIEYTNKSTKQISFEIEKNSMVAKGGDVDFTFNFEYTIPIYNSNKEDMKFKFAANGGFLLQATTLVKDEYIKIATLENATKAFIIDDCLLVMPLMTNE